MISLRNADFFAFSAVFDTSSSDAPFLTSRLSLVGSRCFTFVLLRLTPLNFLGPVTRTKFLSTTSTMTHFLPASRPLSLTHILPTSMLGIPTSSPKNARRPPRTQFKACLNTLHDPRPNAPSSHNQDIRRLPYRENASV